VQFAKQSGVVANYVMAPGVAPTHSTWCGDIADLHSTMRSSVLVPYIETFRECAQLPKLTSWDAPQTTAESEDEAVRLREIRFREALARDLNTSKKLHERQVDYGGWWRSPLQHQVVPPALQQIWHKKQGRCGFA
jgi:hypothetical protein